MNMTFDDYKAVVDKLKQELKEANHTILSLQESGDVLLGQRRRTEQYNYNLKQSLQNIDRIVNTRDTYTNDNSWYQTLRRTLSNIGKERCKS